MSKRKAKSILFPLIVVIVIGIIIVTSFTHLIRLTNNNFSVNYNEKNYTGTESVIILPAGGNAEFTVNGASDYTVKVVPNDVKYTVNGVEFSLIDEGDLTQYFDVNINDNAFTINCGKDYSLKGVLSRIWGTDNITIIDGTPEYAFKLVVESGTRSVEIQLGQEIFPTVKLNISNIIF